MNINAMELFKSIVVRGDTRFSTVSDLYGSDVQYLYGTRSELISMLTAMSAGNIRKYPLIAHVGNFFVSFPDNVGTFNFVICTLSNINDTAEKRMKINYEPVLLPIMRYFFTAIYESKFFEIPDIERLQCDVVINYDYAKGRLQYEGVATTDIVDAVEIRNLKLKLKEDKLCR